MEVLKAFGYVALGMLIQWATNRIAWLKYYEGKREGQGYKRKDNSGR